MTDLVRRFIDDGIARTRAQRAGEAWIAEAREGLAFEAEHLASSGALLARYRRIRTGP